MERELKHTPGPWKAHKLDKKVGDAEYDIHYGTDGECVAELVYTKEDASLIASAPELLEVLNRINHTLTVHGKIDSDTILHDAVLSAINKATKADV